MKPLSGNYALTALQHGVSGLNIDAIRVKGEAGDGVWGTSNKTIRTDRKFNASPSMTEYRSEAHPLGRFPSNVIIDASSSGIIDEHRFFKKIGEAG